MDGQDGSGSGISGKWYTQAKNCLSVLERVCAALDNGSPVDRTLANIYRQNRCYGSRDKQFFYLVIYAYFRWRGWLKKAYSAADVPLEQQLLAALAAEGADPLPMGALPWAERYGKITEALRLPTAAERFEYFSSCPVSDPDLIPDTALRSLAPGGETRFVPFLKTRSPQWVRVVADHLEEVTAQWRENGLTYQRHALISNAFCFFNERVRFDNMTTWQRGFFEIQDFSSQCIGLAAAAKAGEHWFDPCAGGGGKSLQLADQVGRKGTVSVYDIRDFKLDTLQKRADRTPFGKRIRREKSFSPEGKLFDGVLLDAPCSSSGRWRRDPESRWSGVEHKITEITDLQYDLLCKAAKSVRPGGVLIYGTCSVFAEENELLIKRFLSEHGDLFSPEAFPSPHTGEMVKNGMLQTFPADSDCDGSFAARLRKKEV